MSSHAVLSPRAWGRRAGTVGDHPPDGSIPACAGPTGTLVATGPSLADYPRVRGADRNACYGCGCLQGLSPRARGRLVRDGHQPVRRGTIPACAGPTHRQRRPDQPPGTIPACAGPTPVRRGGLGRLTDYPRVRGADIVKADQPAELFGLSPRARGRRDQPDDADAAAGTIPACAGPTLGRQDARPQPRTIPACAGPTLVDLGFYPANERFSFSLTQSG